MVLYHFENDSRGVFVIYGALEALIASGDVDVVVLSTRLMTRHGSIG